MIPDRTVLTQGADCIGRKPPTQACKETGSGCHATSPACPHAFVPAVTRPRSTAPICHGSAGNSPSTTACSRLAHRIRRIHNLRTNSPISGESSAPRPARTHDSVRLRWWRPWHAATFDIASDDMTASLDATRLILEELPAGLRGTGGRLASGGCMSSFEGTDSETITGQIRSRRQRHRIAKADRDRVHGFRDSRGAIRH